MKIKVSFKTANEEVKTGVSKRQQGNTHVTLRRIKGTMRKILNYLLGEELVSEQSDKEVTEWGIGVMYCILMAATCWAMISILA